MKNNVIFPKDFEDSLEWSIEFSRKVIEFASRREDNVYLMPIKSNLSAYLQGVLG